MPVSLVFTRPFRRFDQPHILPPTPCHVHLGKPLISIPSTQIILAIPTVLRAHKLPHYMLAIIKVKSSETNLAGRCDFTVLFGTYVTILFQLWQFDNADSRLQTPSLWTHQ